MNCFEVFILGEKVSFTDWQRLVDKINEYEKRFSIEVVFDFNQVGFYLHSQKDLSLLATKLQGFILKPIRRELTSYNKHLLKRVSFTIPGDKNILEIKEKKEIKEGLIIKKITLTFSRLLWSNFYQTKVFLQNKRGDQFYSSYMTLINPLMSFEFDFKTNQKLKKKTAPLFLNLNETTRLFKSSPEESFLEVFGFPYFSDKTFFSLNNFEFDKHTLIVGQTGVGKSKFIELFIKKISDLSLTDDYRIVLIDPHANLYPQFLNLPSKINFDFVRKSCDLFPAFSQPKIATELTILLFKTLLKDQFNAKLERVLKYVVFVLFLLNKMSLAAIKNFLTELEFRKKVLNEINDQYDYLKHFFDTEFVELQTKFYEISIMPILVLVDELSFIPIFLQNPSQELESVLKSNFLTCFSLNRISLGDKATRLIAGLIIQQVFLLAQKKSINKKIILVVDEVALIENDGLISILSEARKFDLSLFLSQQYLTQITPELLKAILSNVFNYFVFKVSEEDAKILSKNLEIKFPDEILIKEKEKGLTDSDLRKELMVTLNPRECLVRVFSKDKFYPCFKAKTLTI